MYHRHGKNGVTRTRTSYGKDWWNIQREVRERDGFKCTKCGKPEDTKNGVYHHVHHILSLARGGSNSKSNLRTLCESCHEKMPGHQHMKSSSHAPRKLTGWAAKQR